MIRTFRSLFKSFKEKNKAFKRPGHSKAASKPFYDLQLKTLDGKQVLDFAQLKGKKVLLINTASKCGYTPQYEAWEQFHKQYGDKITIIGVPSNDFLAQEPGSATDIETFCRKNYGVSFYLSEKIHVTGIHKHPVYQWLSDPVFNGWNRREPSWNFCKYLINEEGELTHYFGPAIKPDTDEFKKAFKNR